MERGDFSADEWRTLQSGPFWAFTAIAVQDGRIDEKEGRALAQAVAEAAAIPGKLGRK